VGFENLRAVGKSSPESTVTHQFELVLIGSGGPLTPPTVAGTRAGAADVSIIARPRKSLGNNAVGRTDAANRALPTEVGH